MPAYPFLIISLIVFCLDKHTGNAPAHNPVPPPSPSRLFYIQRSSNANVIVYDAQLHPDSRFDPHQPVQIYWLRYAEQGQRQELNWIQRKLAYGLTKAQPAGDKLLTHWVSYRKRPLYLTVRPDGKPAALIEINKRLASLNRVFVQVGDTTGKSATIPYVNYVDLYGQDLTTGTGANVHERFKP